eukprot:5498625-Amphidinium_carterae.1
MVPDSVSLVNTLHSRLLIALSASTGTHYQGLRQAAAHLRRQKAITNAQSKKLERLDDAFNVARHITPVSSDKFFLDVMSTVNAFERTPGSGSSPLQKRLTTQAGGSHLGALQEGVGDELVAMVRASLDNSTRNVVAAATLAAEAIEDRIEALERDWQQKRVRSEDHDAGVEITSENSQTNGMQTASVLTVSDPQVSPSSSEEDDHTFGLPDADVDFLD